MSDSSTSVNAAFAVPADATEPPRDAFGFRKQYFKIHVYEGREKGAESICKVGVNGRAFLMKRGTDVIVPSVVVEALNHAVQEVTVQGEGQLITRPALRYPFQVKGEATEQEYIEFQKKMRGAREAQAQAVAA